MQLRFYNESFNEMINQYYLTGNQLQYTGTPKESIDLAKEDPDRYPVLVIENNQFVTFFVLHINDGVKPYSTNERSILIRAFSTDFRHQGNGYAKLALSILPEFVRAYFSEVNEIILAVNLKNEAAQGLYKKCGFIDNGERRMGRRGELIVMSYAL